MKTIFKKLNECRVLIKNTTLKKAGHNSYSNYDYFTPEQIDKLTFEVSNQNGLCNVYNLIRTSLGLVATLEIFELETGDSIKFELAMEIPEIKATNISQQLGGAMTYSKRYLLMNAYDIADNTLDFDSQKPQTTKQNNESKNEVVWLSENQFKIAINSDIKGIEATLKQFSTETKKMKADYKTQLTNKLNELKK